MEGSNAQIMSMGINGVDGYPVHVEVFAAGGIPGMEIIGLPDASVRESRNRVIAAVYNSGREIPPRRVTINLAPADLKKEGPSFDLPIAVGVLAATGTLIPDAEFPMEHTILFGELSLDGKVRPVHGALPMVISAKEAGYHHVILPEENAREGMKIYPVSDLKQVIDHIEGTEPVFPQKQIAYCELEKDHYAVADMALIRGQQAARRALEVAAAGGQKRISSTPLYHTGL